MAFSFVGSVVIDKGSTPRKAVGAGRFNVFYGSRPYFHKLAQIELRPFKAIYVMVRLSSECVDAVRTTAEVDFLPGNLFLFLFPNVGK